MSKRISKMLFSIEKVELNKVEDLRNSLRSSKEYDGFDELASLNNFAQKTESEVRKKQQNIDEAEIKAKKLEQSVRELGLDKELNMINDIKASIKLNRDNINKVLKIIQQAQNTL